MWLRVYPWKTEEKISGSIFTLKFTFGIKKAIVKNFVWILILFFFWKKNVSICKIGANFLPHIVTAVSNSLTSPIWTDQSSLMSALHLWNKKLQFYAMSSVIWSHFAHSNVLKIWTDFGPVSRTPSVEGIKLDLFGYCKSWNLSMISFLDGSCCNDSFHPVISLAFRPLFPFPTDDKNVLFSLLGTLK